MKSIKQAMENMEYVRRLLEQKQPRFAACLEFAASLVETGHGATSLPAPPDPATTGQEAMDREEQIARLVQRGCPPSLALRIAG